MKKNEPIIIEQYITVGHKKYRYTLEPLGNGATYVQCEAGGIDQNFADEDILDLIVDLPNSIVAEQEYEKKQDRVLRFRCSAEERRAIEKRAIQKRFPNISAFIRALALAGEFKLPIKMPKESKKALAKTNV